MKTQTISNVADVCIPQKYFIDTDACPTGSLSSRRIARVNTHPAVTIAKQLRQHSSRKSSLYEIARMTYLEMQSDAWLISSQIDNLRSNSCDFSVDIFEKFFTGYSKLLQIVKDRISSSEAIAAWSHEIVELIENWLKAYTNAFISEYTESIAQYKLTKDAVLKAGSSITELDRYAQEACHLLELSKKGSQFINLIKKIDDHLGNTLPIIHSLKDLIAKIQLEIAPVKEARSYLHILSCGYLDAQNDGNQRKDLQLMLREVTAEFFTISKKYFHNIDEQKKYLNRLEEKINTTSSLIDFHRHTSGFYFFTEGPHNVFDSSLQDRIEALKEKAHVCGTTLLKDNFVRKFKGPVTSVLVDKSKKIFYRYPLDSDDSFSCLGCLLLQSVAISKSTYKNIYFLVKKEIDRCSNSLERSAIQKFLNSLTKIRTNPSKIYEYLQDPSYLHNTVVFLKNYLVSQYSDPSAQIKVNGQILRWEDLCAKEAIFLKEILCDTCPLPKDLLIALGSSLGLKMAVMDADDVEPYTCIDDGYPAASILRIDGDSYTVLNHINFYKRLASYMGLKQDNLLDNQPMRTHVSIDKPNPVISQVTLPQDKLDSTKGYLKQFFLSCLAVGSLYYLGKQAITSLVQSDYSPELNIDSCAIRDFVAESRMQNVSATAATYLPQDIINSLSYYLQPTDKRLMEYHLDALCKMDNDYHAPGLIALQDIHERLTGKSGASLGPTDLDNLNKSFAFMRVALQGLKQERSKDLSQEELQLWEMRIQGVQEQLNVLEEKAKKAQQVYFPPEIVDFLYPKLTKLCTERCSVSDIISHATTNVLPSQGNGLRNIFTQNRDETIVLHVLGDIFGLDSGLEGGNIEDAVIYIKKMFENGILDEEFSPEDKDRLLRQFNTFSHLSHSLKTSSLQDFRNLLRVELSNLLQGESLVLEGGWKSPASTQNLLYEIKKIGDDRYSITLFNTGEGLQHHITLNPDGRSFSVPAKELTDISLDDLTSYSMLHAMQQLHNLQIDDYEVQANNWNAETIYNILLLNTNGRLSDKEYAFSDLLQTQFSHTESYRVWMAYLHQHTSDKRHYERAVLKISLKTLVDYHAGVSFDIFVQDETKRRLCKKSLEYLSKHILLLHQEKIISEDEFAIIAAKLAKISSDLDWAQKKSDSIYRSQEENRAYNVNKKGDGHVAYKMHLANIASGEFKSTDCIHYRDGFASQLPLTEAHFNVEFAHFVDFIEGLYRNREFETTIDAIRTITSRLGFGGHLISDQVDVLSLVNKMGEEELHSFSASLQKLSHRLFQATIEEPNRQQALDASSYLSQMKIVFAIDLAMNRFCSIKGLKPVYLLPESMRQILHLQNNYFVLFEPREEEELAQLFAHYTADATFAKNYEKGSFFSAIYDPDNRSLPHDIDSLSKHFPSQHYLFWDYLKTREFKDAFFAHFNKRFYDYSDDSYPLQQSLCLTFTDAYQKDQNEDYSVNTFHALPDIFYSARDVVTIAEYMLKNSIVNTRLHEKYLDPDAISYIASYQKDNPKQPYSYALSATLFARDLKQHGAYRRDRGLEHARREYNLLQLRRQFLPYMFLEREDRATQVFLNADDIRRHKYENYLYCPNMDALNSYVDNDEFERKQISGFFTAIGSQRFREIASLDLRRELQVVNALGYFHREFASLHDKQYQGLLEHLIFEPGVLMHELTQSQEQTEAIINSFKEFINKGINWFTVAHDYDTVAFFCEFSIKLSRYITYLKKQHPDIFPLDFETDFIQIQRLIRNALDKWELSVEQKNYLDALRSWHLLSNDELSRADFVAVFSSYINFLATLDISKDSNTSQKALYISLKKDIERRLVDFHSFLQTESDISDFITLIIQNCTAGVDQTVWTETGPFQYVSVDNSVHIDLKEGTIRKDGGTQSLSLAMLLEETPALKEFFSNLTQAEVIKKGDAIYDIITGDGFTYRITKLEDGAIVLQRLFGSTWYQFFPYDYEQNRVRVLQSETALEKAQNVLTTILSDNSLNFIPKYFASYGLHVAFAEDYRDLIFFDTQTHLPVYRMQAKPSLGEGEVYHLAGIEKFSPDGKSITHTLVDLQDVHSKDLFFLHRFENRDYTLIWKDIKTEEITSIEFPRCGLQFHPRSSGGQMRFFSEQFKGFYISNNQYIGALGSYGRFIVLENEKGVRKAIFPDKPYKISPFTQNIMVDPVDVSSLSTHFAYVEDVDKLNQMGFNVIDVALNAKNEIAFTKLTQKQKLYLAGVLLSEQNYDLAHYVMNLCKSSLFAYSPSEVAILDTILRQPFNTDPRASLLKVRAASLLAKNSLDFFISHPLPEHTINIYYNYLLTRDRFDANYLALDEEKALIHGLLTQFPNNDFLLSRLKEIDTREYEKTVELMAFSRANSGTVIRDNEDFGLSRQSVARIIDNMIQDGDAFANDSYDQKKQLPLVIFNPNLSIDKFKQLYEVIYAIHALQHSDTVVDMIERATIVIRDLLGIDLNKKLTAMELSLELKRIFEMMLTGAIVKQGRDPSNAVNITRIGVLYAMSLDSKQQLPYYASYHDPKNGDRNRQVLKEFTTKILREHFIPIFPREREPSIIQVNFLMQPFFNTEPAQKRFLPPIQGPLHRVFSLNEAVIPGQFFKAQDSRNDVLNVAPLLTDASITAEVRSLQNSLDEYSRVEEGSSPYELIDYPGLRKTIDALSVEKQLLDRQLVTMEYALLSLANKRSQGLNQAAFGEFLAFADVQKPMTLQDLKLLFLENNSLAYQNKNPDLSSDESLELYQMVQDYLIMSTYNSHLSRIRQHARTFFSNMDSSNLTKDEQIHLIEDFRKVLLAKREYAILDHPEYLVFEDALGILLYKSQVDNLDRLVSCSKGIALEMVVGAGKTQILAPLIAKNYADGEHLSVLVMPEELFPSMSRQIEASLGESFRQQVQSFHFDRRTHLGSQQLQWIYGELEKCIKEKKVFMTTPQSLQSLYLLFIETLYNQSINSDLSLASEYSEQITVYRQILMLLKNHGKLLIDELHVASNPNQSHHFTFQRQEPNRDIIHNVADIFRTFVVHFPSIIPLYQRPLPSAFSKDTYHATVKQALVDKLINGEFFQDPEMRKFFTKQSHAQSLAQRYLQGDDSVYGQVKSFDSDYVKDRLALAREMIEQLLPLTLSKQADENFGLSKVDAQLKVAIPFHGSDHPAEGSQFGTSYEIMNYTLQYYLKKGVPRTTILEFVHIMLRNLREELQSTGYHDLEQTNSFKQFCAFTGGRRAIHEFINIEKYLDDITKIINSNPETIIHIVENFILPTMNVYEKHIRVGPDLYDWMFDGKVSGFTGTLWNPEVLPSSTEVIPSSEATGKIVSLLLKNSYRDVREMEPSGSLQEIITGILSQQEINEAQAIIDAGAYFRGYNNYDIALALLDNPSLKRRLKPIKGIVFYDHLDRLKILQQINGRPTVIDYSAGAIPQEQLFTLYDQKHTVGSDIPQAMHAHGIITIGAHVKLSDMIQAAGRLRKLDKGQKAVFVVSKDIRALFNSDTNALDIIDIIRFSLINQAKEKDSNNFKSFKNKLSSAFEFAIVNRLLSDLSDADRVRLFNAFHAYFILGRQDSPFQQFGQGQHAESKQTVVADYVRQFRGQLPLLDKNGIFGSDLEKLVNLDELSRQHLAMFPDTLPSRGQVYDFEVETQVETQVEMQQQVENIPYEAPSQCTHFYEAIHLKDNPNHALMQVLFRDIQENHFSDGKISKGFIPALAPADVFNNIPNLQQFASLFDSNLLATQKILPMQSSSNMLYPPFADEMRTSNHALLIQRGRDIQWVMLDDEVAADLKSISLEHLQGQDYKLALFHLGMDDFTRRKEAIFVSDTKELTSHPDFLRLKVQMKFFNGIVAYSQDELKALEKWMREKGVDKVKNLFEGHILPTKDFNLRMYPTSNLYQLFNRLAVPVS